MASKKPQRPRAQKPRRVAAEILSRTLHVHGLRIEIEVPAGRGARAELDRACEEELRRIEDERVGGRVRRAHPQGRPVKIEDADLAAAWCAARRSAWLRTARLDAVSTQVRAEL